MEKQVPNLQLTLDFAEINPKKRNLKSELLSYNLLKENIQGYIRLEILTKILHPLRRYTTEYHNTNILKHVENNNFQLNLLQDSTHLTFRKFLEVQKLLFIIKGLQGKIASFNFKQIDILSSLIHFQADSTYDLETSVINLLPAIDKIPEKQLQRIHFYLKSIIHQVMEHKDTPSILDAEDLAIYNLSTIKSTYPEILETEFKTDFNTMLNSYYFQKQFSLTYH